MFKIPFTVHGAYAHFTMGVILSFFFVVFFFLAVYVDP